MNLPATQEDSLNTSPINIDDLLASQEQVNNHATLERIPDDDERVKVTPYVAGRGCLCDYALRIRKDAIETVATTGETHICCGKTLQVVEIAFADASLTDVFTQLLQARQSQPTSPPIAPTHSLPTGPVPPYFSAPGPVYRPMTPQARANPYYAYAAQPYANPGISPATIIPPNLGHNAACWLQCLACQSGCNDGDWHCTCECLNLYHSCTIPHGPLFLC